MINQLSHSRDTHASRVGTTTSAPGSQGSRSKPTIHLSGGREPALTGSSWPPHEVLVSMPGSSLSVLTSPTIGGSSSSYRRSAAAASPSARPSRLAVDARSRSTPRPRTRCASIATAQLLGRDFAGDAYADRDLVFADELGKPVHPQRLTEWFRRHRKAAGGPRWHPSYPPSHGRDAGADVRRPGTHRGGETRRYSGDGARDLRPPAAAVGRNRGRACGGAARPLAPGWQIGRKRSGMR